MKETKIYDVRDEYRLIDDIFNIAQKKGKDIINDINSLSFEIADLLYDIMGVLDIYFSKKSVSISSLFEREFKIELSFLQS